MDQKTTETPRQNKWVAYAAFVCIMVLTAAGIKALITSPDVITNREVVMMPNDSLQAMREEIAVLRSENETLRIQSETRANIIYNLTEPMQGLTDSLLALARVSAEQAGKNGQMIETGEEAREQRYAALMEKIGEVAGTKEELKFLLAVRPEPVLIRDTVYATLPERRSWLDRLLGRKK